MLSDNTEHVGEQWEVQPWAVEPTGTNRSHVLMPLSPPAMLLLYPLLHQLHQRGLHQTRTASCSFLRILAGPRRRRRWVQNICFGLPSHCLALWFVPLFERCDITSCYSERLDTFPLNKDGSRKSQTSSRQSFIRNLKEEKIQMVLILMFEVLIQTKSPTLTRADELTQSRTSEIIHEM